MKKHKRKPSSKSAEVNLNIRMLKIENQKVSNHQVKVQSKVWEAQVVSNPIVKILINRVKVVQIEI